MTGVRSPSKHSTVAQLSAIRESNYIGAAKEYSAEEVDDAYYRKIQRKADRIDFADAPGKPERKRRKRVSQPRLILASDRPVYLCDFPESQWPFIVSLGLIVLLYVSLIVR